MQNKDCNFFKDQIYDYMADALDDAMAKELLEHIESCPECKRELDTVKAIISASAVLPQVEVPDWLKASVFEKLGANKQSITPKRFKLKRFASVALPAVACIALSIGIFSGGLYDKFSASDSIISSGDVNPAPIQANTEHADAAESPESADISTNAAPDNIKKTLQPEAEHNNKNAVSSPQVNSTDDSPSSASDNVPIASNTEQIENVLADPPSLASVNSPRERFIDEPSATGAGEVEQTTNDSITVASSDAAKTESAIPKSCTVITENISAFSNEFGVNAEDGELHFELEADKWQEFLSFAEDIGAELNSDYSAYSNGYVSITICIPY